MIGALLVVGGRRHRAFADDLGQRRRRPALDSTHPPPPRALSAYADGEATWAGGCPGRARGRRRPPMPVGGSSPGEVLPGLARTFVVDGSAAIEESHLAPARPPRDASRSMPCPWQSCAALSGQVLRLPTTTSMPNQSARTWGSAASVLPIADRVGLTQRRSPAATTIPATGSAVEDRTRRPSRPGSGRRRPSS